MMSSPKGRGRDRSANRSKSPMRSSFASSEGQNKSMVAENHKAKIIKLFETIPKEIESRGGKWTPLTFDEIEQNSTVMVDSSQIQWVENVQIEISGTQGIYTGQFLDKLPHGIGRFISSDGEIFEGQFLKGKRHDYLRHIQKDGTISIGKWKSDEPIKTQKFLE